jgi:N utilization substance protein B
MYRRSIREQIFKLLFRVEFNPEEAMPQQENYFFEAGDVTYSAEDREEISAKYENIVSRLPEIDAQLEKASQGWELSRLGKVELTLLRLGVYEIEYDDRIPEGVAINEAVELAGKFGQESAPAFVNAVLGKFTEEGRKKAEKAEKDKTTEIARKVEKASRAGKIVKVVKSDKTGGNRPRHEGAKVIIVKH